MKKEMAGKNTKVTNTSNILKTIWLSKGISRTDISKKLRIDKSTVTVIVTSLLRKKIVFEEQILDAGPKGGRKPVILKINNSFGFIAGIEIHADFYRAVLINFDGKIVYSFHNKKVINITNISYIFEHIISRFINYDANTVLLGVGLSLSGVINSTTGEIIQSLPLDIYNFDIQKELQKHVSIPVYIENDANACCLGELVFNKNENLENFLFLLVEFYDSLSAGKVNNDIGVGIGFVFNRKIHHGQNHSAGEFRSIRLNRENKHSQLAIEPKDSDFINFAEELSEHIAFLANTLNLNHIFIGGDLENYKEIFTPHLQNAVSRNWVYKNENECHIHYSSFGKFAAAYGAAGMMMNNLFTSKEYIQNLYFEKISV